MTNGKWNGAKWIRRDKRLAIYARDGFRCAYCGSSHKLNLDHLKPRSKGGNHRAKNLITACQRCNLRRGDNPWWKFAGEIADNGDVIARIKRQRRRSIKNRRQWAKSILRNQSWSEALEDLL